MDIQTFKKRKKKLKMTNRQLADISGVSLGTVNKIFSGATKSPQLGTMNALGKALGLSADTSQYRLYSGADKIHEVAPDYAFEKENGCYTLDDYYNLPDDVRAELIDGYLIVMDAPTIAHQDIIGELFYYIKNYIKQKRGPCKVILSPVDIRLDNDARTIIEPDLIVVCDESKLDGRRVNGAPDFVVEVTSPSSKKRDYVLKLNKYLSAGVREYWIIDPEKECISVYSFTDKSEDFTIDIYTFHDKIPVTVFQDLAIDFEAFDL